MAQVKPSLVVCVTGSVCDVAVNSVYTVVRVQIEKGRWCLFQKAVQYVDMHILYCAAAPQMETNIISGFTF